MFRYVGKGEFHHGIPKRDLTDAEFEALSDEQKSVIRQGGLYRPEDDEQPHPEGSRAQGAPGSKSSSVTATGSLSSGKSSKE